MLFWSNGRHYILLSKDYRGEVGIVMECETCANYCYDEEYEEYLCDVNMDEDEYVRIMANRREVCPFYRNGDEYRVVRKQM